MLHRFFILLSLLALAGAQAQVPELVKDCYPGNIGVPPIFLGEVNGKVIFNTQSPDEGREPWVTDGTTAGTQLLVDILPGSPAASSQPTNGFLYNGLLYFYAHTETPWAMELWRTDGTPAGTELFLNAMPGVGDVSVTSSHPPFIVFNGLLYFLSHHPVEDFVSLWRTDGTQAGTEMVSGDMELISDGKFLLAVFGDHLYFAAWLNWGRGLYRMDAAGNIEGVFTTPSTFGRLDHLTPAQSGLYFIAEDLEQSTELWWTDGTPSGTVQLSTTDGEGPIGELHNWNHSWCHLDGDTLLYPAHSTANGLELWRSDATAAGTHELLNLGPDAYGSDPRSFFELNGLVYFTTEGAPYLQSAGLWSTDGTAAGTVLRDTLAMLELFGVWNDALYFSGGQPRQLQASLGGTDDLVALTALDTATTCCQNLSYIHPTDYGILLSIYADPTGPELYLLDTQVGMENAAGEARLQLFPNPVTTELSCTEALRDVRISDACGRLVHTAVAMRAGEPLDLAALQPGLYLVSASTLTGRVAARFIKE